MFAMILPWLWQNKKLIVEIIGLILLLILCWWFFIHNPKVIKELEADKSELSRQIEVKNNTIKLYGDIEKGKVVINEAVQLQISSLRSQSRPRRTVIIRAGGVLPPLSPVKAAH